jgi:hypothetical protein
MRSVRARGVALVGLALLLTAAEASAVSQSTAISLTFPIGARYNATGEAGTALATDVTAMWWNPGGFAFASDGGRERGLHFMYSPLVEGLADDVSLNWIGYGQYLEGWGMLGASFTFLDQGEQVRTDDAGNDLGTFNSNEWSLNVSYGVKMAENLGVGLGVKYVRINLAGDDATQDRGAGVGSSWAVDLGALYRPTQKAHIGVAVTNLGGDVTFIDEDQSDPLPRNLRVGLAYDVLKTTTSTLTLVYDYLDMLVEGDATKVHGVGAEWGYANLLYLRGGYKSDPEGDIQDYTAGVGFDFEKLLGFPLYFDYATVPQAEDLDRVNRISLQFLF